MTAGSFGCKLPAAWSEPLFDDAVYVRLRESDESDFDPERINGNKGYQSLYFDQAEPDAGQVERKEGHKEGVLGFHSDHSFPVLPTGRTTQAETPEPGLVRPAW
jgi:hypothetical protein